MLGLAMNLLLAHVTGVPHHPDDLATAIKLWPVFLAILEVSAYIARHRLKQAWSWVCGRFIWFSPRMRTCAAWTWELERSDAGRTVGFYCQFGWRAFRLNLE
jgi:hypothetical protein